MVIRRQLDIISSIYMHYVKQGGKKRAAAFLRSPEMFCGRRFSYDLVVETFKRQLGSERLLVAPKEWLNGNSNEREQFVNFVFSPFGGYPAAPGMDAVNRSEQAHVLAALRYLNIMRHPFLANGEQEVKLGGGRLRVRKRIVKPLREIKVGSHVNTEWRKEILAELDRMGLVEEYRRANKCLSRKFGLGLAKLGYWAQ
jgi:hypothetical protein